MMEPGLVREAGLFLWLIRGSRQKCENNPMHSRNGARAALLDDADNNLTGQRKLVGGRRIVIASAAKQSRIFPRRDSGLLRCARNDGRMELGPLQRRAPLTRRAKQGHYAIIEKSEISVQRR
jgi:hypothetical protein